MEEAYTNSNESEKLFLIAETRISKGIMEKWWQWRSYRESF